MYDLDVAIVDTFAVGDGAWVVHNCDVLMFAIGNIEDDVDISVTQARNLLKLKLFGANDRTVFSGIHHMDTDRWLAFPSEYTSLPGGQIPFNWVNRRGGHRQRWRRWLRLDPNIPKGNLQADVDVPDPAALGRYVAPDSGLTGFTLAYTLRSQEEKIIVRFTSTSVNGFSWGSSELYLNNPVWSPSRGMVEPIPPVLQALSRDIGIMAEYTDMSFSQ